MKHAVHLVGAGALAGDFEDVLDDLPGAVMVGDESTSVVTLTFDAWGRSRTEALTHARRLVAPVIEAASARGQYVGLIVARPEREGLLSRLRRRRRARA
jgi:hypothetical protein